MTTIIVMLALLIIGIAMWKFSNAGRSAGNQSESGRGRERDRDREDSSIPGVFKIIGAVSIAASFSIFVWNSFVMLQEGEEGILMTFGKAEDVAVKPGLHLKAPWQGVEKLSTLSKTHNVTLECSSKDLQEVTIEVTVIWRREKGKAPQIWRRVGDDSETVDVAPGVQEVLKALTARYDATEIIGLRSQISSEMQKEMRDWIGQFDLEVDDCSIARTKFSDAFQHVIEAKQLAYEQSLKAGNEQAEAVTRADIKKTDASGEANAAIENAKGQAEALVRNANSEAFEIITLARANATRIRSVGEAEAMRLSKLGEQLRANPAVVQLELIKKWKGHVPEMQFGGGANQPNLLLPVGK